MGLVDEAQFVMQHGASVAQVGPNPNPSPYPNPNPNPNPNPTQNQTGGT